MICGSYKFHYAHLSRLLAYASRRGQDARRGRVAILHPKNRSGVGGDVRSVISEVRKVRKVLDVCSSR